MLRNWWKSLSPQWRQAFNISVLLHQNEPTDEELGNLVNLKVLRLAGPEAPYPNCPVLLSDLSGLASLDHLEIVIITHHNIENLNGMGAKKNLNSLFLFNNHIKSLQGIEALVNLEKLYVQCNELVSIAEVKQLIHLKELYISDNKISSLEGLTEVHADNDLQFFCKPNKGLKQKEIIYTERELGIICK